MLDIPPRCAAGILWLAPLLLLACLIPAWGGKPPGVTLSEGQILLLSGSPAIGFFRVNNNSDTAMVPGKNRLAFVRGDCHLTC